MAPHKKIFVHAHFFLARRSGSCILQMRTRSTDECRLKWSTSVADAQRPARNESEDRPRRTRVKIEFFIAPCHVSFPRDPNSEKKSRQTYPLAACGCHFLHGVRRHVRNGRDHSRRGLPPRHIDLVVSAGAVVLADRAHDWRTLGRASCGGRLLRVGPARLGKFLGLSRSMALAGREYFRYGDLPDSFCFLSEADVAVVRRWKSWDLCGPVCGGHVRSAESSGNSRSRNYFAVAF